MARVFLSILTGIGLFCFCAPLRGLAQGISVSPSDPGIQYEGRMGQPADASREIYWPGSSIRIRFSGTGLRAVLKDQRGKNFYDIILDEDSVRCIRLDSTRRSYELASGLPEGEHTVELFRRNGWSNGITWFYGFDILGSGPLLRMPEKEKYIEFYGNSITVGSGMYPDKSAFGHENNDESYATLTARHFHAAYDCIARSGIGLMVSWFPMIMPEMYNLKNPFDSTSHWDFSGKQPGIVVINLGQNDYSLLDLPNHPEFVHRFGNKKPTEDLIVRSYAEFVRKIRKEYPKAYILCVLGNMDACKPESPWPHYIEAAAASLKDPKVYTHIFAYKNTPDHPNAAEHRQMAQSLIRFIDEHIPGW